jgi:protein FAM50
MQTPSVPLEKGNNLLQTIQASEGGRALKLLKQREKDREKLEQAKAAIDKGTKKTSFKSISTFGQSQADILEEQFRTETIGLVSADEFREKRRKIDDLINGPQEEQVEEVKPTVKRKVVKTATLSFGDDVESSDDDAEVDAAPLKKGFGKNPTVDTSFLPDAEREAEFEAKRQALLEEYQQAQEEVKKQPLEVAFVYWDGSGHRRNITVPQGTTIGKFLHLAKTELIGEFPELKSVVADHLMFIKEDTILPNTISFHDLIKNKARGKSGPLFEFNVRQDVRLGDVRVQKGESHAGKIVERKWYNMNKHIFPASRWEVYDPTADRSGAYTIKDAVKRDDK